MVVSLPTLDSAILEYVKADGLLREGHFVYPSGRHSAVHLDHDRLLTDPESASRMGYALAKAFFTSKIETIASPSMWGAGLAQWVAYFLEPRPRVVYAALNPDGSRRVPEQLHPLIAGRRILIVDNVTLSGETVQQFSTQLSSLGGEIIGVGCLWAGSRPNDQHEIVGLLNSRYPSWSPAECPLCVSGTGDLVQVAS